MIVVRNCCDTTDLEAHAIDCRSEMIDRQLIGLRTGDESADMIIADLERRLNRSADKLEAAHKEIKQLRARR